MFTRKDHKEWREKGGSEGRPPTPEDLAAEAAGAPAPAGSGGAEPWWVAPRGSESAEAPAGEVPPQAPSELPPTPEALGAVPVPVDGRGPGLSATPEESGRPEGQAAAPWQGDDGAPGRVPPAPLDLASLGAVMVSEGRGPGAASALQEEQRDPLVPDLTALRPAPGSEKPAQEETATEDAPPAAPPRPMIDAARFAETHGPRLRIGSTAEQSSGLTDAAAAGPAAPMPAAESQPDAANDATPDPAPADATTIATTPAWANLPTPGDAKAEEDGGEEVGGQPDQAAEDAQPAAASEPAASGPTEAGEPWRDDRTVFATSIAAAFGASRRAEGADQAPEGSQTSGETRANEEAPLAAPHASFGAVSMPVADDPGADETDAGEPSTAASEAPSTDALSTGALKTEAAPEADELGLVAVPPGSAPLRPLPAEPGPIEAGVGAGRRVVFAGAMCALDPVSGAAISMRSVLETLAEAGYAANSFTASIFDANGEVPFAPVLGAKAAEAESRGKLLRLERNDVEHWILLTKSSRGQQMNANEQRALIDRFKTWLDDTSPDMVLSYGTSALAKRMRADARAAGAQIVHYLANAEIEDKELIEPGDRAMCPSAYLADLYRDRFGVEAEVLHPVIHGDRSRREGLPVISDMPALRKLGFVTFINPIPHKGLTLVARLVARAAKERPDLKFLVLEGRMPREALARMKVDLAGQPNVWWLPAQTDMAAVYARTSVLLVPSFWAEGFGRSVVEAQLAGVPVLVGDRGGLPEALGGGGVVLPIPDRCAENHYAAPDDATVTEWFETIVALWDDEETYSEASTLARDAAQRFSPEANRDRVLGVMDRLFEGRVAAGG